MTSTPRPDPDPGHRRFSTARNPSTQVTPHIGVFIDNSVDPEAYTLIIGERSGSAMMARLTEQEIGHLIQALHNHRDWPHRYAGWVD